MSLQHANAPRPLPFLIKAAGSVFALGHLCALVLLAMEAQSGPWIVPPPHNVTTQLGPLFARVITERVTFPYYLKLLHMTHNYHFDSNRPEMTAIRFEVQLKDAEGKPMGAPLLFPDPKASQWTQQRHLQLARGLGNDQPVMRTGVDLKVANPKGQTGGNVVDVPLQEVWTGQWPTLHLTSVPEQQAQTAGVKPAELALVLVRSYARHLCRKHGAASAEITRVHRDTVVPAYWFTDAAPPPATLTDAKSHFGDYPRE